MRKRDLAAYGGAHFLVDCACACLFAGCFRSVPERVSLLLLYNFCAFALQMPVGVLLDRFGHGGPCARIGCLLVALALAPGRAIGLPFVRMCVAGIGNAMFHAGGGVEVLHRSRGAGTLGIFVSPGALGLFLGMKLYGWAGAALAVLLVGCSFLLHGDTRPVTPVPMSWRNLLATLGLFGVVGLRSWLGMGVALPWKSGALAICAVCATAFGKALGGLAADRLGARRVGTVSLVAAAALYFAANFAAPGLLAILLFQMTMPLTLRAASDRTGRPGFAFGLLTFGLFLGYLPVGLELGWMAQPGWVPAAACLVSAALLLPCLRRAVRA